MGRFVVDKCCFCIDLKTGCFILGYLSLVGYSILALFCILAIAGGAVLTTDDHLGSSRPIHQFEINGQTFTTGGKDNNAGAIAGTMVIVFAALLLIFVVLFLTFVIVLLVGLHKNKPGHVKAYVIYSIIFIIIAVIGFLGSIFGSRDPGSIAQTLVSIAWNIYTTLVIRSQYFVMKSPERGPAIYNTA